MPEVKCKPASCAICYSMAGLGVAARFLSGPHRMRLCKTHYEDITTNHPWRASPAQRKQERFT